jgi:rhodanese-related sulfurtransferase
LEEMKQGRVGDLFFLLTGKNLVLYCDGGDCESSTALARILSERGVRNIRVMLGGWVEWLKAGLPEAKE